MVALLLMSLPALAATLTVDQSGTGDHESIQAAIEAAEDGDEISIAAGTYSESIDTSGKSVTLAGASSSTVIVESAGDVALTIQSGENVTVSKMTFKGGIQGVNVTGSTATLKQVIVKNNGGQARGGGIGVFAGADLTLKSSYVQDNATEDQFGGGGIYISDSTATLSAVIIRRNSAYNGGGILADTSTVTIDGCQITSNSATEQGGGLRIQDGSTIVVDGTTLTDNSAGARGGGAVISDSDTTWTDTEVSGNTGEAGTGGLHFTRMLSSGSSFEGQVTGNAGGTTGAGIYLSEHDLVFSGTLAENELSSSGSGAGIYATASNLTMDEVEVYNHRAAAGGAIYAGEGGSITLTNASVHDNASTGNGGAIYSQSAVAVDEASFEDNEAGISGGAIYVSGADVEISHGDFWRNAADALYPGGAVYVREGNTTLKYNTWMDNEAGYGGALAVEGAGDEEVVIASDLYEDNIAWIDGGGAYFDSTGWVRIRRNDFIGNTATTNGGGMTCTGISALVVYTNDFYDNEAETGGGLYVSGAGSSRTEQSNFGGNTATKFGGGAAFVAPSGTHSIYNDRFVENRGTTGGGLYIKDDKDGGYPVSNVDLAGNDGDGLYLHSSPGAVVTNTIAYNNTEAGIRADSSSLTAAISYSDAYGNVDNWGGDLGELAGTNGNISADPLYQDYARDGDPTLDYLYLLTASPCRDAGDPELSDPNGSRSDMGSFGGPSAIDQDTDGDGDGYAPVDGDCDDEDETVYPGAADSWYDGVDQDCDRRDDFDADGDGYRSETQGNGDDCDDDDPAINPAALDTEVDGIDNDCDGLDGNDEAIDDTGEIDDTGDEPEEIWDDADGDGHPETSDCDDNEPLAFPGNYEDCGDGIDNDCDGAIDAADSNCATTEPTCGCATRGGRTPGALALLLAIATLRRRRNLEPTMVG